MMIILKSKNTSDATSDYGARQYSAEFCQWMQVDPLAEKYYSWSPYNFCVGNPLKYVDMDGREILITDSNGQTTAYAVGMEYNGNDQFMQQTIAYLNAISEVDAGKYVINELGSSQKIFNFKNEPSVAGDNSFQFIPKNNTIKAAAVLNRDMSNFQKSEGISHELFHAYQLLNGRNPATINAEVEAYLFGNGVAANSRFGSYINNYPEGIVGTDKGFLYSQTMLLLSIGDFSDFNKTFNSAVNLFKEGSAANAANNYRNTKIDLNYKPIIQNFLPLRK